MALPSVWISFELVHMHLRTRLIYFHFLKVNFLVKAWFLRPTSSSAVTTATIHRAIQIWLFLFIPPDNLPPHKKWRGVKNFSFPTLLHFPGELLSRVFMMTINNKSERNYLCWPVTLATALVMEFLLGIE